VRGFCKLDLSPSSRKGVRWRINKFIAFVRLQHPEETGNDFKIILPRNLTLTPQHEPFEVSENSRIPTDRFALIIDACAADVKAYLDAKATYINQSEHKKAYQRWYYHERRRRPNEGLPSKLGRTPRFKELHSRAIKGQAVILAGCTGRRVAAVCDTRYDVRTEPWEWINEAGQKEKGVMVRFRELKMRHVDEDVPCPGAYGELALNAIATAKDLTSELRELAPECKDHLFIIPSKNGKAGAVLSKRLLNQYLNGQHGNPAGLINRYDIPGGKVKIHDFRKTRASNAWRGGLEIHDVARDLGHVNADMTSRFYVAGGEECKRRFQAQMDRGALSGALLNMVGGREIMGIKLGKRHVEIMKRHGLIISATRYGYCALPASSGPCPRTNPCYVGPGADGGGCDYHLLSPDALPALREDEEVVRHNISTFSPEPEYKTWVVNNENQLRLVEGKISEALTLQHRFEGQCSCDGGCRCGEGPKV
jgi:integrase